MNKFRRVETMDDIRTAIGTNRYFFDNLLEQIEGDQDAFADMPTEDRPTCRGCLEHYLDDMHENFDICGDGEWIIDYTDHRAYLLEVIYESKSDLTFLMRTGTHGEREFCGWYHGEPNEECTQEFYAEYQLA